MENIQQELPRINNLVGRIIDFESGAMDEEDIIPFFSDLIKTGTIWGLQGSYQRYAQDLIREGILDGSGNIL